MFFFCFMDDKVLKQCGIMRQTGTKEKNPKADVGRTIN
jgi:hypothetical protein